MKEKKLLYSIVVPIYNVEEFLKECIESLINQTYTNIEIILVDDGSPDNCSIICDEFAKNEKRIKVIHKTNGGLVSARKAGAKVATGDYVICVDGDDHVSKDMVTKINKVVSENDVDVVCFGYFKDDESNPCYLEFNEGYYNKEKIIEDIFPNLIENANAKFFSNSLWAKAYKRDLYCMNQELVDNKIKIGEDAACTKPIISKCNSLYIMKDCLYFYRTNLTSMTKEPKPFAWDVPEIIYSHLSVNLNQDDYDFTEQLYRNVAHNVFNVAMSQYYKKGLKIKEIKREIKEKLGNKLYSTCIKKANYTSIKGKIMLYALRHNSSFIMKLYSKIR